MSKKIIIIIMTLTFLSINLSACSQNVKDSQETEDFIKVETLLKDKIEDKERAMLSIADDLFLIVVKNKNNYTEYFVSKNMQGSDFELKKSQDFEHKKLYSKMFDRNIYKDGYITFDSDFFKPNGYEMSSGNVTYFVYKDSNNKRFGESRLSVFIKPNPVDAEVYLYMINRILEYNNQG